MVILNTPGQNVNAAEPVFDMMLHSEVEVTGRRCAFYHDSITEHDHQARHKQTQLTSWIQP